ncbi:hypothetical protein T03_1145 [Trichinella britovi]|uniref:Uncharacterized protein n=1 Tax=Trichinella britovi TaxID=45882 RepID=A0A0V1D558_TRIBR|nr:hypothetical protein T03_1145 [Trichinella britovi]
MSVSPKFEIEKLLTLPSGDIYIEFSLCAFGEKGRPGAVKFIMFPSCSFMGFKHFKRMPTHVFFGQTNHLALDLRVHMLKQKHHSCQVLSLNQAIAKNTLR